MATKITCPVKFEKRLFDSETEAAIAAEIKPFDLSEEGDLVGVSLTFQLRPKAASPINAGSPHFYVRVGSGVQSFTYRSLRLAHPDIALKAADFALNISSDPIIPAACRPAIKDMDPNDGEDFYTEVMLTSHALIVSVDDLSFSIEVTGDGYVDDENIDSFICMVLPEIESAHKKLEFAPKLAPTMDLIAAIFEVLDEEDEPIQILAPNLA